MTEHSPQQHSLLMFCHRLEWRSEVLSTSSCPAPDTSAPLLSTEVCWTLCDLPGNWRESWSTVIQCHRLRLSCQTVSTWDQIFFLLRWSPHWQTHWCRDLEEKLQLIETPGTILGFWSYLTTWVWQRRESSHPADDHQSHHSLVTRQECLDVDHHLEMLCLCVRDCSCDVTPCWGCVTDVLIYWLSALLLTNTDCCCQNIVHQWLQSEGTQQW